MFEKFNQGAQRALILGQEAAAREKHSHLGTEHMMFGLLQSPGEVNATVFKKLSVDLRKLVEQVEVYMGKNTTTEAMPDIPFSNIAKESIEKAVEVAKGYGEETIESEHLLLGMLQTTESDTVKIFKDSGFKDIGALQEAIRQEIDSTKKRKKILSLLDETASKALVQARQEAIDTFQEQIGTEHLLLGLIKEQDSLAYSVLHKLGADMRLLQKTIKEMSPPGEAKPGQNPAPGFAIEAKSAIENAEKEAKDMGHSYLGTEHLLLGIFSVKTCAGASALNRTGISNIVKIRSMVTKELEKKAKS